MERAMNDETGIYYRAVIFDLDGTLLDSIGDIADSINAALVYHGYPVHDQEQVKTFIGDGIEELVKRALPRGTSDPDAVRSCLETMRTEYANRWNARTLPFDGIPELLNTLTRNGMKMSVLSNKPDDFTKIMIKTLLPEWIFAQVRGARPDFPQKPDPASACLMAEGTGNST